MISFTSITASLLLFGIHKGLYLLSSRGPSLNSAAIIGVSASARGGLAPLIPLHTLQRRTQT